MKLICLLVSIITGVIIGTQTAHRCCVEYRTTLGWIIGTLTAIVLWSLLYTLFAESYCKFCSLPGRISLQQSVVRERREEDPAERESGG